MWKNRALPIMVFIIMALSVIIALSVEISTSHNSKTSIVTFLHEPDAIHAKHETVEIVNLTPDIYDTFDDRYSGRAYYYNFLTDKQKAVYQILQYTAEHIITDTNIEMPEGLSQSDLKNIFKAFFHDNNAKYFWLYHSYTYMADLENDIVASLTIYSIYYTVKADLEGFDCGKADIDEINRRQKLIDEGVKVFLNNTADKTEAQIVRIIHDNLITNAKYNFEALNKTIREAHSIYGIFVDRTAVCEGFAYALKYLLNSFDIDCYYVVGNNGTHAWNLVKIDGNWYELDITWDNQKNKPISYKYFNITTEQISKTHTRDIDDLQSNLPIAKTVRVNKDYHVSGMDDIR